MKKIGDIVIKFIAKPTVLASILAVSFGAGVVAGMELGKNYQPAASQDADNADKARSSLRDEFFEKIGQIQDQIWAKEMELESLLCVGGSSSSKAIIDEVVKLRELRGQLRSERVKMYREMKEMGWGGGPGWWGFEGGRGRHDQRERGMEQMEDRK